MGRVVLLLWALAACSAPAGLDGKPGQAGPSPPGARSAPLEATIHRDEWGVPHVFGPTDASVVWGYAYARAEDELERVERAVYVMLGRNAEVLGEPGLVWDRLVHAFEIPRRAQEEYAALDPELRELADAWAAGTNLVAERRRGRRLIERFEPWHLIAQGYALHLHAAGLELRKLDPSLAPPIWGNGADGSNAWAVAPERTTEGRALLLSNPHMPFEEVYEGHLHSDQGLRVTGASAYGRGALPRFGANETVAWSLTVNRPDVADVWRVRFEPEDGAPGRAYRFGPERRRAFERAARVRVLGAGGVLEERELRWLETHHGPVLSQTGDEGYALRVAGMERGGALESAYALARAGSVDEVFAALESGGLLFHNVVAADAGGQIGYLYNALVPRRDPGFDWSQPVDGNNPSCSWNGYHSQADQAQLRNPDCGWLQNCNSRPESTCPSAGIDLSKGPAYLLGLDQDDGRVPMSHAVLGREEPFSFADWCAAPFDRRVHRADAWIDAIEAEVEAMALRDSVRVRDLRAPLAELRAWDQLVAEDSVAATLFLLTYENLGDTPPLGSLLVSALERTLRELRVSHGSWRVAWGQLNRHQRALGDPPTHSDQRPSWPVSGGHGSAGLAWAFLAKEGPGSVARYGYHGHSYVAAIQLGSPPRIRSIVPFGASRDPGSQHFQDQAPLFARGELKEAWFTEADVRAHAQSSESPAP